MKTSLIFNNRIIKQPQPHEQRSAIHLPEHHTYSQQVTTLCTIIEKLFDSQDNQPLSAHAHDLKQCYDVFKQHPDVENLITHLIEERNLWNFVSNFNTIPEENYPPEVHHKIKKITQALSEMSMLEKISCVRTIQQKFNS